MYIIFHNTWRKTFLAILRFYLGRLLLSLSSAKMLCKGLHVYGTGIYLWWLAGQRKGRNLSWIRLQCTLDWFILFTKNELSTCVLCCEGLMDVTSRWQIKWILWSMSKHCTCRGIIEYVCFIYLNSSNTDSNIFFST